MRNGIVWPNARVKPKPHICLGFPDVRELKWVCKSPSASGFGRTTQEAYRNWKDNYDYQKAKAKTR